jgi:hypothetical protein
MDAPVKPAASRFKSGTLNTRFLRLVGDLRSESVERYRPSLHPPNGRYEPSRPNPSGTCRMDELGLQPDKVNGLAALPDILSTNLK